MGRFANAVVRTTPTGQISIGDINTELGIIGERGLGDTDGRVLAGVPSGEISLDDYRGKSNVITEIIDEYFGVYRRGDQGRVITGTFTYLNTLEVDMKLNVASQPEGSDQGQNRACNSYTIVKVYNEVDELIHENRVDQWTYIGGDNKINFTNRAIVVPRYTTPHKITVEFRFDLGNYKAHMDGERYDTSVVNNFKFYGSREWIEI